MNLSILRTATGASEANAKRFLPYLKGALERYEINTNNRIIAFLAQAGHETAGLKYITELASGAAYEGRADLGNKIPGDGKKYKGRGIFQTTGRYNYQKISKELNQDFINHPEWLAPENGKAGSALQLRNAVYSAAYYWKSNGLNELADKLDFTKSHNDTNNIEVFKKITKRINGGYNGLADRQKIFAQGWTMAKQFAVENKGSIAGILFFFTAAGLLIWKRKVIIKKVKKLLKK